MPLGGVCLGDPAGGSEPSFDPALLRGIRGTVWRCSKAVDLPTEAIRLPAHEAAAGDTRVFAESFAIQYRNTDPGTAVALIEEAAGQFVVQEKPQPPLSRAELDAVYALHFERAWHPVYTAFKGVPAAGRGAIQHHIMPRLLRCLRLLRAGIPPGPDCIG
ncbi:hypothetical protein MASR2M48_18320 [Spirochaetota bacterium]